MFFQNLIRTKQEINDTVAFSDGFDIHINNRPIQILHVLYKMDRGGAETWLLHILRTIDRKRFRLDILVHHPYRGAYDDEVEELGARLIYLPYSFRIWTFFSGFKRLLREYGPYDIIHTHLPYGGFHLLLASKLGIPIRILHNHSSVLPFWHTLPLYKKLILKISDLLVYRYATAGLAVSELAATGRFGPDWSSDPRWRIFFCGIDLKPFQEYPTSSIVRQELGIPLDTLVIGHVGRFSEEKNHHLIINVALQLAQTEPNFRLLLVGDGPMRREIECQVEQAGLKEKVLFTGMRTDVPRLLMAMDVFLFPSFFEGLPIALLEAQAAGLRCVISDTIPSEADVVKPLIRRLSLSSSPSIWSDTILAIKKAKIFMKRSDALKIMEESPFNIDNSCEILTNIYEKQFHNL